MSDWRLQGQERFLYGVKLERKRYTPYREGWDHDHCEFCSVKFSESLAGCEREGWATEDNYYWICCGCYEDFKKDFAWR